MKHKILVVLVLLLCTTLLVIAQEPIYDHFVYLPLVVGGGPTLTPTETPPQPSTPTSTPTPMVEPTSDPRGVFALPNAIAFHGSSSITQDECLVAGEIQNDTLDFVKDIHYTVYVRQDGTLQYGSSGVAYWTIPPGGKVCFRVSLGGDCLDNPPLVVAEVTSYVVGSDIRVWDIAFGNFRAGRCFDGEVLRVDSHVHNNEPVPIKNIIYRGTLYDGSGNLLGCRTHFSHPSTLFNLDAESGTDRSTYFSLRHYAGGPVSFRFVANGDLDANPTVTPTPTPGITVVPGN